MSTNVVKRQRSVALKPETDKNHDLHVHKSKEDSTTAQTESHDKNEGSFLGRVCRKFLRILKYVIILVLIPPFLNYAALLQESAQLVPSIGAVYDIGLGQKLFLGCNGTGLPTVILDAPTGLSSDAWSSVAKELSKLTKVCVYDRAGIGFSERPFQNYSDVGSSGTAKAVENRWKPFTVERMVDDLHRLITYSSQQPRPLLLVGAEMGALVAQFYTQLFEGDVSDLVLIDPIPEDLFTYEQGIWSQFWSQHLVPSFQAMQLTAALGLARLALIVGLLEHPMSSSTVELPDDVVRRQKHLLCNPRHLSSVVDEHFFINESLSQIRTVFMMKSFPQNVSVTIIHGDQYDNQMPSSINKAWTSAQKNLISKIHPSANKIVINGADHHVIYRRSLAVVEPIRRLINQWRTTQNLS